MGWEAVNEPSGGWGPGKDSQTSQTWEGQVSGSTTFSLWDLMEVTWFL